MKYPPIDFEYAKTLGLDSFDWERVIVRLGRAPNEFECAVIAALWSEDFSNKSSSSLLETMHRDERVRRVRGSRVNLVDIGDGYHLAMRCVDRNKDLEREPGVGPPVAFAAASAELVAAGATPLGAAALMRIGNPELTRTHAQLRGSVEAAANFSNRAGIPLLSADIMFHASFNRSPMLNAAVYGTVPTSDLPPAPGDAAAPSGGALVHVGADIGRDGLRDDMRADFKLKDAPPERMTYVRMSDPLMSNRLASALEEAYAESLISGAATIGSGGIATASFEVAAMVGRPVKVDLDRLPRRFENLTPRELLLSETSERLLVVVPKANQRALTDIFYQWDVPVTTVGETIDSDSVEIWSGHQVISSVPFRFGLQASQRTFEMVKFPPMLKRAGVEAQTEIKQKPKKLIKSTKDDWSTLKDATGADGVTSGQLKPPGSMEDAWLDLLASPNLCSRSLLLRHFDQRIGGRTILKQNGDALLLRLPPGISGRPRGLASTFVACSLYSSMEPYLGTVQTVALAMRRLAAMGAKPIAVADCMNYGDPSKYREMCDLSESIRALSDSCREWSIPIVSDTVDLFNGNEGAPVLPTPAVLMAGVLDDYRVTCEAGFRQNGDIVLVAGDTRDDIDCSEYSSYCHRRVGDRVPEIDFAVEKATCHLIRELVAQDKLQSCVEIGPGGLAAALSLSAMSRARPIGVALKLPQATGAEALRPDVLMFSETSSRFLISVLPENEGFVRKRLSKVGIPVSASGTVGGKVLQVSGGAQCEIPVASAYKLWLFGLRHMLGLTPDEAIVVSGF